MFAHFRSGNSSLCADKELDRSQLCKLDDLVLREELTEVVDLDIEVVCQELHLSSRRRLSISEECRLISVSLDCSRDDGVPPHCRFALQFYFDGGFTRAVLHELRRVFRTTQPL